MAFNPNFTPYQPQTLIVPNANGSGGWRNIGAGLKIAGGIGSWLDAKDRAKRMNEAQENWYNTLSDYIDNANPKAPAYTDEQLANYSDYLQNRSENAEMVRSLPDEEDVQELNEDDKLIKYLLDSKANKDKLTPEEISYLQSNLGVNADGVWGKQTQKAYNKKLQQLLGFTGKDVDGIIGPKTLAAINAWENL